MTDMSPSEKLQKVVAEASDQELKGVFQYLVELIQQRDKCRFVYYGFAFRIDSATEICVAADHYANNTQDAIELVGQLALLKSIICVDLHEIARKKKSSNKETT